MLTSERQRGERSDRGKHWTAARLRKFRKSMTPEKIAARVAKVAATKARKKAEREAAEQSELNKRGDRRGMGPTNGLRSPKTIAKFRATMAAKKAAKMNGTNGHDRHAEFAQMIPLDAIPARAIRAKVAHRNLGNPPDRRDVRLRLAVETVLLIRELIREE